MRLRKRATAFAPALFWIALGAAPAPSAPPAFAVVSDCANPKLAALPVRTVVAPKAILHLSVAADERTRELGLMCVTGIRPRAGMIFVFDEDASWEFWMKLTLIPLDMIWVHADGRVDTVAANVPASTRATSDEKVARRKGTGKYVIELAAGEAARDGIVRGACLAAPDLKWNGCASGTSSPHP